MAERDQAEELARSADRITEAVRELTSSLERLSASEAQRAVIGAGPAPLDVYRDALKEAFGEAARGRAPLTEEGADELALAAVHRAREEHEEDREVFGPPDAEAADIWALNREETRERRNRTWKPPRLP